MPRPREKRPRQIVRHERSSPSFSLPRGKTVCAAYLAPEGLIEQTASLVPEIVGMFDRLLLSAVAPVANPWAQNIWLSPRLETIASISDAVKKLVAMQRNWWPYRCVEVRRTMLIAEQLPKVSAKPLPFPARHPTTPLGSFTLLDRGTLLCSALCASPFANGEAKFDENRTEPPSRAYLKLWEALTIAGKFPERGERCLDIGASPGGWTWVLSELGAEVTAVDGAPLSEALMRRQSVHYLKADAFTILPETHGPFDWIVSDMVCYPDRLFPWLSAWTESGRCRNFVVTVKFQGTSGYSYINRFQQLDGGRLIHLFHNKHELTWIRIADSPG